MLHQLGTPALCSFVRYLVLCVDFLLTFRTFEQVDSVCMSGVGTPILFSCFSSVSFGFVEFDSVLIYFPSLVHGNWSNPEPLPCDAMTSIPTRWSLPSKIVIRPVMLRYPLPPSCLPRPCRQHMIDTDRTSYALFIFIS